LRTSSTNSKPTSKTSPRKNSTMPNKSTFNNSRKILKPSRQKPWIFGIWWPMRNLCCWRRTKYWRIWTAWNWRNSRITTSIICRRTLGSWVFKFIAKNLGTNMSKKTFCRKVKNTQILKAKLLKLANWKQCRDLIILL
jgi:hypothetical protein